MERTRREQHPRDRPNPAGDDPSGGAADPGGLAARHPRRTALVPADPQRQRLHRQGDRQPHPRGRRTGRPRRDPGRLRPHPRRERDQAGRLGQPHLAAPAEGRRQGGADPARRGARDASQGCPGEGPALRRQDAAALLERFSLPADPGHQGGDHPAGDADNGTPRGLPRDHRPADRRAPLHRRRGRQPRPGARLPLAGHRRGGLQDRRAGRPRPLPAGRPDRPGRTGVRLRPRPARHRRHHQAGGGQSRPGHRHRRPGRPADRQQPGDQHRRQGAEGRRGQPGAGDGRRPQDLRQGHQPQLRGRLRRRRRDGRAHRADRRDGQCPHLRPQPVAGRHQRQGLPGADQQGLQLPAAQPGHTGSVRPRLDLQGHLHHRRRPGRLLARRPLRLPEEHDHRRPRVQELRERELRGDLPGARPGGLLRHRLLRPGVRPVDEGRRHQAEEGPGRLVLQDRPPVRPRRQDRHRPPQRGHRPGPRPAVEAVLLRQQQGRLVQAGGEGRQHLLRPDRPGELRRRLPDARR